MQIKNAVSMIPYGLLSGIVDGQEVRITQLGETDLYFGWQIRLRKSMKSGCSFFRKMEGAIRSF